jgi:hypothetical protein
LNWSEREKNHNFKKQLMNMIMRHGKNEEEIGKDEFNLILAIMKEIICDYERARKMRIKKNLMDKKLKR